MIPSFSLQLENDILPKMVVIGKYDGKTPQLTCATPSGKIFLHNPLDNEKPITFLSVHQDVKCLVSGFAEKKKEVLFVGMENHLLCYDVEKNSDIFFLQITDGVGKLLFSSFKNRPPIPSSSTDPSKEEGSEGGLLNRPLEEEELIFVGGNCSIIGYDHDARERFWNIPGGDVTELMIHNEHLYVATDDHIIYVYNSEGKMKKEIIENDLVTNLVSFSSSSNSHKNEGKKKEEEEEEYENPKKNQYFGYSLQDGTFGVYDENNRKLWSKKSKHPIVCMNCFDFNQNGKMEMILGFDNGTIEIRRVFPSSNGRTKQKTNNEQEQDESLLGELLYSDEVSTNGHSIISILIYDYKQINQPQLIIVTSKGEVKGYLPKQIKSYILSTTNNIEEEIEQLKLEKSRLNNELRNFEENFQKMKYDGNNNIRSSSLISTKTEVKCRLKPNPEHRSVDIIFESNENTFVKLAIVEGDYLFSKQEKRRLFYVEKDQQRGSIAVGLRPIKDVEIDLHAKVLVGSSILSQDFHVFELDYRMPRFSMYVPIRVYPPSASPHCFVEFKIPQRNTERVIEWFNGSFNIVFTKKDTINVKFACLRDHHCLRIEMKEDGRMKITTDNILLAGDLIQDLTEYLTLQNLESRVVFPELQKELGQLLSLVHEFNKNKNNISTEMADTVNIVKALFVKAEDCRVNTLNMNDMRTNLTSLRDLNMELIGEFKKRSTNQSKLIQALKRINWIIQNISRLRIGDAKKEVVRKSREAIQKNNIPTLFKLLEFGSIEYF